MDRTFRILTLTANPALDCSCESVKVRPIHKIRTFNERYDAGGGGVNVARAIKQLDGAPVALYLAGGATGTFLDQLIDAAGAERCRIDIEGNTRISHNVFERETGLEYRFVPDGPLVSQAECDALLSAIAGLSPQAIVASGSLPRGAPDDFYVHVSEIARAQGVNLYLDSSGAGLETAVAHGGIELVKPSLSELHSIAGKKLPGRRQQEAAAMDIVRSGRARLVAVTLGREGGFLASSDGVFHAPAPRVEVKSAVGAGDSFLAAMVMALMDGSPPQDAFLYGMAAGAAAVTKLGTQLCHREDVDRIHAELLRELGRKG